VGQSLVVTTDMLVDGSSVMHHFQKMLVGELPLPIYRPSSNGATRWESPLV